MPGLMSLKDVEAERFHQHSGSRTEESLREAGAVPSCSTYQIDVTPTAAAAVAANTTTKIGSEESVEREATEENDVDDEVSFATAAENLVRTAPTLRNLPTGTTLVGKVLHGGSTNTMVRVGIHLVAGNGDRTTTTTTTTAPAMFFEGHGSPVQSVVVRLFGANTERIIDRQTESIIAKHLQKYNMAKQIFHQFKGGQIEEWLAGREITDMEMPILAEPIGQRIAQLHGVPLPEGLHPNQSVLWATAEGWLKSLVNLKASPTSQRCKAVLKSIDLEWLKLKLESFREAVQRRQSSPATQLVLSHNDLLAGNILLAETDGGMGGVSRIQFIDWEYGGIAERFFDLSNYLCEYKGLDVKLDWAHSEDDVQAVVKGYAREAKLTEEEALDLTDAINEFIRLPDLYWGLWALLQAATATKERHYASFALNRLALLSA